MSVAYKLGGLKSVKIVNNVTVSCMSYNKSPETMSDFCLFIHLTYLYFFFNFIYLRESISKEEKEKQTHH